MTLKASYIFLEDELAKAVEEGNITCVGQKDILTLALDTSEHPGRVRGKGGKKSQNNSSTHQNPQKLLKRSNVKGC